MQPRFQRFEQLITKEKLELLQKRCVLIVGCGGVGGYVVEGLVRSNIGKLILVDYDTVELSNCNRQIIAMDSTVGEKKIELLKKRAFDINPDCQIEIIDAFITEENKDILFKEKIDYLVDACDTVSCKKLLLRECQTKNIPIISCMGTGNRFDPSLLEIVNITKTKNDPLARILRKYVKDEKLEGVLVLASKELPVKTESKNVGSTSFVPASAGILIASFVVREFLK